MVFVTSLFFCNGAGQTVFQHVKTLAKRIAGCGYGIMCYTETIQRAAATFIKLYFTARQPPAAHNMRNTASETLQSNQKEKGYAE